MPKVIFQRMSFSTLHDHVLLIGNIYDEKKVFQSRFTSLFSEIAKYSMAYGPCWEPTISQISLSMNLINAPTVDPSRPLPFWDKCRILFHGRLTASVAKMSWLYHASQSPYNKTEMMDWTWSNLILDWTTGEFKYIDTRQEKYYITRRCLNKRPILGFNELRKPQSST